MIDLVEKDGAIFLKVRVIPRSSKSEIIGDFDNSLKVKLSSPPVDGAANAELIKLLCKELSIPKNSIEIVSGNTSKQKLIKLSGVQKLLLADVLESLRNKNL